MAGGRLWERRGEGGKEYDVREVEMVRVGRERKGMRNIEKSGNKERARERERESELEEERDIREGRQRGDRKVEKNMISMNGHRGKGREKGKGR